MQEERHFTTEQDFTYQHIANKLNQGLSFGLFDDGCKCYFEDRERVSYNDLWRVLKIINNIQPGDTAKTLSELCLASYEGVFPYKLGKHKWKKRVGKK